MNLILLGPPGAGKGTQARLLEQKHGCVQLSSGELFRSHIAAQDTLGIEAQSYMDKGNLVPDELTIRMLEQEIDSPRCKNGFILDGFIRTIPQAEALDKMLEGRGLKLDAVIELIVDDAAMLKRIVGRFTCAKCGAGYNDFLHPTFTVDVCDVCGSHEFIRRADDNPHAFETRMQKYRDETMPVLPYYQAKKLLHSVNAMLEINQVAQEIEKVLERAKAPV
jgi:adenylate kinase